MQKNSDHKLITCVVPHGQAKGILETLAVDKEVIKVFFFGARKFKFPEWVEVEIIEIAISNDKAEEVFDYICEVTNVDSTPGIMVYQGPLPCTTSFSLSDFKIS